MGKYTIAKFSFVGLLIYIIQTLNPVLCSNRVFSTFELTFLGSYPYFANTYNQMIIDLAPDTNPDFGIFQLVVSSISYTVSVCTPTAVTVTPTGSSLSGTILTITNPYPASTFDVNGKYNGGTCPQQIYTSVTVVLNCQISSTYSGTLNFKVYSKRTSNGLTSYINQSGVILFPDIISDSDTSITMTAASASKQILQTGTYLITMKTPLPQATVTQISLTLPNTWCPEVVSATCPAKMPATNPATFTSTKLGSSLVATLVSTSYNTVTYTLSFNAIVLNADTVDLTFTMTNPYSTQNIVLEGMVGIGAIFKNAASLVPFQTTLTTTSINALPHAYTNCNTQGTTQILCSSTSTGTYSNANCLVGSTMYVQLLLMPMLFQDIYSSVQFTVSNLPLQISIAGITMNVQNFTPTSVGLTVSSTQSTTTHTIYFSQYLSGTNVFPITDEFGTAQTSAAMCMDNPEYLQVNIPNMQLPYDINGLNIAANFYVQPFVTSAAYVNNARVTTAASALQNASCGSTQLTVNQNTLVSAAVTTATNPDLQVGATAATHTIKIMSSYQFLSTAGKIVLTLPNILTINTGTFACTCSFVLPTTSLLPITVSSCTQTGSPVVITLSYTYAGTQLAQGFQFTINQVINPTIITYTGEFSVATYLKNGPVSDVNNAVTVGFGFTTIPAPFTTATMVNQGTGVKTVYIMSPYLITLVSPVAFTNGNKIKVTFPSFISEINTVVVTPAASGITVTTGTNVVPLIISFTSTVAASTTITLAFNTRNPPVSNKDYTYTVQALTATNAVLLQSVITYGSADSITLTTFSQFLVSSSSTQNLLSTAVYTISFTSNVLLAGPSTLVLTYTAPTTTFNFFTTGTTTCASITAGLTLTCALNSPATNQISVTLTSNIAPATNYQFTVSNAFNYMSLSPYTVTGDLGYSMTQLGNESTTTVTNTSILSLTTATISISDTFIGDQATYTFTITGVTPAPTTGGISISTTNLVTFNVATTTVTVNAGLCAGTVTTTTLDLPCFPAVDPTTIVVTTVNNPTQLVQKTTPPFTISLYETAGTKYTIKSFSNPTLVYTNACNIASFCKTCLPANTSNCQSCYPANTITYSSSATFVAEVILNQVPTVQTCVATCPTGTYQTTNAGMQVCQACDPNCTACITASTQCTACSGALFLNPLNQKCENPCPTTYYGSANKCLPCNAVGNCLTCTAAGVCQTCDTTLYKLQGNKCVTACDPGYYETSGGTVCTPCPTGCSACTSSTNCTACTVPYIFYLTTCVTSCPTGFSRLLDATTSTYYCGSCDPSCKTCDTLSTTCTSCFPNTYLYQSKCIIESAIPSGYYGDNTTWTALQCMPYCAQCSFKTLCAQCSTGTVIYQGVCYTSCPSEAPTSDGAGGCKAQFIPASVSENSSKIIPFPMLLACIAFCISVYFSKYEKPQTFVPGCVVGFCAIFEWISWLILIAIAYLNDGITNITTVAAIIGFIMVYLFNILTLIYYKRHIVPDTNFVEWTLNHKNKMCKNVCVVLACLFSFKIQKIIFCKYFNQNFFKAKLKDIDVFSPFNKITILSVVFNSFFIILSAAIFSYKYQSSIQLFILSLDTLLVTMFMIIFMIWEALKNDQFFDETYSFNFQQMSQYTQQFYPFDHSYMEKVKQRSVYGHLKRSESNSSLMEFNRDNKVCKIEGVHQPLSDVMDPNDISTNAALDRNVLNNAINGAPYVIQDDIIESSKPGRKRQFQKNHIAPVFDHTSFPPIQENSQEDEDEYYNEQNQSMKHMYQKQNSRTNDEQEVGDMNQSRNYNSKIISLYEHEDVENQKNRMLTNRRDDSYYKRNIDGHEPEPGQMNQSHTIYYDPHDQSGVIKNISMGVDVQEDEDDGEGEEIHQQLFSKQQRSDDTVDKTALIAGTALVGGAAATAAVIASKQNDKNANLVDEEGNIIDKNGNKIDKDGNIIDKDGNKTDKNGNRFDKNGNRINKDDHLIDKDGHLIDKDGRLIDKDGHLIDKEGNLIDKDGHRIDKNGNKIDKNGNIIDKDGNIIDKEGNIIDKDGNKTDKNGNRFDKNGNRIDKDGNLIDKDGHRIDKNGNKIDKNGNIIDKDGNIIDKDGNVIDKHGNKTDKNGNRFDKDGNRIDKDGHKIDKNGNKIDKDGNIIDKDGNIIDKDGNKTDKNGNRFDKNGNRIDKDGNLIDKDGHRIDKNGNKIDKDGNIIDKDGNIIDKDGNKTDKNGNRFDKNGNRIDKDGNLIDKDGHRIDKDGNKIDKDGKKIEDKTKNPHENLLFYLNNPIEEKDMSRNDQAKQDTKVEKIMPEVEDLDAGPTLADKQNEKNIRMLTPNDRKACEINQQGPQKNNLFGVSDEEDAVVESSQNKPKNNNKKQKEIPLPKNNIYDSDESLHTASEAEINFNEISPSDFNILNQRYDDDYVVQPPQSALQMQLLQQSLSQLNKNYYSQVSGNEMGNQNLYQSKTQNGQYSDGIDLGQKADNPNLNKTGNTFTVPGRGKSAQRQPHLLTSQSNASLSANPSRSSSPSKRQKQLGLTGSRSQNTNALSIDVKQNNLTNSLAQSKNISSLNRTNNNSKILPIGNPTNQLVIENFDDLYNNTSSQSGFQQGGIGENQFNKQGNISNRSPEKQLSNANMNAPPSDGSKLKNLEKIYLKRMEAEPTSSQSSRLNTLKNKKKPQRQLNQHPGLQVHGNQEKGQKFDPTMLDNHTEEVIDFDEDDMGPENVNFDQNF